jgi:HAD superfamily hydrolase (TIGR01509 family)
MTSRYELIIFDCDGVLIDSEVINCAVEARLFTAIGYQVSTEEVMRRFVGIAARDTHRTIERELGRPLPADFEARKTVMLDEAYARELRAVPGVDELLTGLHCKRCVASSTHPDRLRRCLELVGLYDRFAPGIFSATMVPRGKPAPDLFLHAAARMDSVPKRCLVIEDSVPGIASGKAASMTVFGFHGASHARPGDGDRLLEAGADAAFATMTELAAFLSTSRQA